MKLYRTIQSIKIALILMLLADSSYSMMSNDSLIPRTSTPKRIEAVSKQITKVSPVLSKLEWSIDQASQFFYTYIKFKYSV